MRSRLTPNLSRFLHRNRLAVLLIVYGMLAVVYSIVTPIFEAPDENFHFAVIQHIAETGQLPVQNSAVTTPWYQEGSQPPLYYLISAPIAVLVPGALNVPYPLARNPHAQIGIGLARINRNVFLHTSAESFPWHGVPLAVHLIRLISTALGAWTVFCIFRAARLIFPEKPTLALIAAAFVAFNPMFIFIHASINNDTLVTALSATALWLIFRELLRAQAPFQQSGATIVLSVILALAAISKLSGATLYIVVGAALLAALIKRRIMLRQAIRAGTVITLGFAVIAAWWYVRNLQLYGDLTGLSAMITIIEPRKIPYTLWTMLAEMQGLRISSWALFGWLNVIAPDPFLILMDALTGLALMGGVVGTIRVIRRQDWDRLLALGLLGWLLIIVGGSLINWTRLTPGTQGRLLFPALPAIAILTAFGWTALRPRFAQLALLPLLGMATAAPLLIITPAYAPPLIVASVPDDAHQIDTRFDMISVTGIRVDRAPASPGGDLPVTLYYRGQPDPRNLSLFLTAYDCHKAVIGKVDSYPGGGNLPTSQFDPNALYADSYRVPLVSGIDTPCQPYVEFGWWDFASKIYVKESGSGAQSITLRGGAVIDPSAPMPHPATAQSALFGGALRLNGYTLDMTTAKPGDALHLTLNWQAHATIREDFTVFVHLETADHTLIGQADAPPLNGDYPTSVWAVGRAFDDPHTITVRGDAPPGTYQIAIGFYRPRDNSRLPVDVGGDTLILNTPIRVASR